MNTFFYLCLAISTQYTLSVSFLTAAIYWSENDTLPIVEIFAWNYYSMANWVVMFLVLFSIQLAMCWVLRNTSEQVFLAVMLFTAFAAGLCLLFTALASSAVCDPLVRIVSLPAGSNNAMHVKLLPFSEVVNDDPSFMQDVNPTFSKCVSTTKYAKEGQQVVAVAVLSFVVTSATLILTFFAYYSQLGVSIVYLTAQALFTTLLISVSTQIVFNTEKWDWRVGISTFLSFLFATYCSVSFIEHVNVDSRETDTKTQLNLLSYSLLRLHTKSFWAFYAFVSDLASPAS